MASCVALDLDMPRPFIKPHPSQLEKLQSIVQQTTTQQGRNQRRGLERQESAHVTCVTPPQTIEVVEDITTNVVKDENCTEREKSAVGKIDGEGASNTDKVRSPAMTTGKNLLRPYFIDFNEEASPTTHHFDDKDNTYCEMSTLEFSL